MINLKKIPFKLSIGSLVLLGLLPVISLFAPWHLFPVRSFHTEWLAIMSGLLAWLLVLPLLWQQQYLLIPRIALLPLLLMAFIGIQAQLLPLVVIQHAQMGMLYLLWAALLMVLVKLLVTQTDRQYVSQWIAIGLSVAAVLAAAIETVYRLKGISGWWGGAGQANNYADLLALGLASVLYLAIINKPISRVYLSIATVIIVLGLSLTPSRSVWLYWIAIVVITLLLQRHTYKWVLSGLGLYILLQVLWSAGLFPSFQTGTTAAEKLYQGVSGASVRFHIWQVAWQLFTDSPWLGQGFGEFDWGYFQVGQHTPEASTRIENSHNLILQLLAELGLLPVLALLGFLGIWLQGVLATVTEKRQNDDDNSMPFYTWLLMLLAILGIHSLLEYPLWYAQFLGMAVVIFALGETQYWQVRLKSISALAVSLLITFGIAIAGVHEWHYSKLETALDDYTKQKPNQLLEVALETANQAPLLTPYAAVIFSMSANLADEQTRSNLTTLNNASYHFLPAATLAYQKAELQALNGFENEAQQTMKLALAAYPDWTKNFIAGLTVLNAADQKKTAFLRKMAE